MGKFFILTALMMATSALAQGPSMEPMPFKPWKDQQVVEAQNQVARVSNRIVLLKAGRVQPEEISAEFNNFEDAAVTAEAARLTSKAQKMSSNDVLARLEKELSQSQKGLEFARDLGFQEYFLGYLTQFQENSEAISSLAGRLTKDEVTELLKVLLKSNQSSLDSGHGSRGSATLKKLEARAI